MSGDRLNQAGPTGGSASAPKSGPVAGRTREIAAVLVRARSRARAALFFQAAAEVLAALVGALLLAGFIDFFLRTPGILRGIVTGLILFATAAGFVYRILPAIRFRPSLSELALRLERTPAGEAAGLRGRLASALELESNPPPDASPEMIAALAEETARKFAKVQTSAALLAFGRTGRSGGWLASAMVGLLAVAVVWPSFSAIGARRILTPWSAAEWPKRTEVVDATAAEFHAVTSALTLRAVVTKTPNAPGRTDVAVDYRILRSGKPISEKRALLTAQGKASGAGQAADLPHGEVYERLVEPSALDPGQDALWQDGELELEYTLRAGDDRTQTRRIMLVRPPEVLAAIANISAPEYAKDSGPVRGEFAMGDGTDTRAVLGPVLAGSTIDLKFTLSKPVPTPDADGAERRAWLEKALPGFTAPADLTADFSDTVWHLSWRLTDSVRLAAVPTDAMGVQAVQPAAYRIDVVQDGAPTATMLRPEADDSVLPTAVVEVTGEARDDVALTSVALERQTYTAEPGSQSRAANVAGERVVIESEKVADEQPAPASGAAPPPSGVSRSEKRSASLALEALELKPGEEVWLTTLAADGYNLDGKAHEPTRSPPRRLKIISETEFVEQVRTELSAVRQAAIRAEMDQTDVQRATQNAQDQRELTDALRRQGEAAERVRPPRDLLNRIASRMERNQLGDQSLQGLVDEAKEAAENAERASREAEKSLREAQQTASDKSREQEAKEAAHRATTQQEAAKQELGDLIDMLEQGQDSWAARRQVEKILEEQKRLQQQTAEQGAKTAGRDAQSLTPEERQAMEQIAQRQEELAQRTAAASEQMAEAAKAQAKQNPEQSAALSKAAQRARENRVQDRQQDAAEEIRANRPENANQLQEEAKKALEQMLQDLEKSQQDRDERLRRQLAELVERLGLLVREQQVQIDALAPMLGGEEVPGLDVAMARLHLSTLTLAQDISGKRETARIAELVSAAGAEQAEAIALLRKKTIDGPKTDEKERESLRLLTEAKAMAEKAAEQAADKDADRKRQELRQAYIESLAEQNSLIESTEPLAGKELSRRERQKAAETGERQETLRQSLADLRQKTTDLAEARVFDYAHQRLDSLMTRAAGTLRAAPSASTLRDQRAASKLLQVAVDALKDAKTERNDKFRDPEGGQESGGEGGGGGQQGQPPPLIPPIAEMRFLRGMQEELAQRTREIAENPAVAGETELEEIGRVQRDLSEQSQSLIERASGDKPPPKPDAEGAVPKDAKPGTNPDSKPDQPKGTPPGGAE
jgi:hypothetical protein